MMTPYPVRVHSYLPTPQGPSSSPSSSAASEAPRPVQTYEHIITTATTEDNSTSTSGSSSSSPPENALVFVGGLGDGPHTIPYVRALAERLARARPRYAVFEARLSSAFSGFGRASLARDARELADLVRYLRAALKVPGKIVVMGHSTGCQGCVEYGTRFLKEVGDEGKASECWVDGFVLQAPVSDREAIRLTEESGEVDESLRVADGMVKEGRADEIMPRAVLPRGWRGTAITAYRWWSLAAVG